MSSIIITRMEFGNILSYGQDNVIEFNKNPVTQLVGKNGAGKSSIATILEEALYNKNSRGIKKDELFNWHSPKKEYSIKVFLIKEGIEYEVHKDVKSTAKIKLLENGKDISGHTATQTYKLIEDIIGCNFATFTKLVYQSIGSSLDFLKTTDANRKAFLTTLFSQEQYKEVSEEIKKDAKIVKSNLDTLNGKLSSIQQIIKRTENMDFSLQEEVEIPEFDEQPLHDEISETKVVVALAADTEAKIIRLRNLDKSVQVARESFSVYENSTAPTDVSEQLKQVTRDLALITSDADKVKKRYQSFKKQSEVCDCPTCGRPMDISEAVAAASVAKKEYEPLFKRRTALEEGSKSLKEKSKEFAKYDVLKTTLEVTELNLEEFKQDNPSIDITQESTLDISSAKARIDKLTKQIREAKSKIALAMEHNSQVSINNSKVITMQEQLSLANKDLVEVETSIDKVTKELSDLEILATSFKDLVSYKLEHCVKTFEELINSYLSVITSGKFALGFELDATKLVVVIYNDGIKTSMESCSTGQQHRIQLATLLAIRSLMSAISKVNINILFLDEVISFIDTQGISTLIELLTQEHELNSFLVSHGMTHPLAKVIKIEQDSEGTSRLIND